MPKPLVYLLIVLATTAHAAKPDWVVTYGHSEKYPHSRYLVGFGTASGQGAEPSQIAEDNARASVSRQIVVNVQSVIRTAEEETNHDVSEYYSAITQSSTALQLMGLGTELYVDSDFTNPTTYALAHVSRDKLRRIYTERASQLRDQIRRILADTQAAENASRTTEAVEKYLSLYPLYAALKEAETILLVAKQLSSVNAAFDELEKATTGASGASVVPLMSLTEVTNRVDQLVSQSMTSVDDIARAIVFRLSKQVSQPEGKVLLTPLTYQDTKMSSPFARYLLAALETQIGQMVKWNAVSQTSSSRGGFRPRSAQIMRDLAKDAGAKSLLSGTYWENGDEIKLLTTLRDVGTGKVKAGAEVRFDRTVLVSANLNFKPQNYKNALIEQKAFAVDEVVSGALQVEMWTNKGSENLLYTEGETMKVFVRVNREAYIRLLYILADGPRTLLYDNYYIDQSKVNRAVEIPEEFECDDPFGAELLIVEARTEAFPPIDTYERDGYLFLKAQDAEQAAVDFRGMKKKSLQKQQRTDAQQSEARIVLTTMEH